MLKFNEKTTFYHMWRLFKLQWNWNCTKYESKIASLTLISMSTCMICNFECYLHSFRFPWFVNLILWLSPHTADGSYLIRCTDSLFKFQSYPVPNGGFETLPESLITKQLHALLQTRDWETAATKQGSSADTQTSQTSQSGRQTYISRITFMVHVETWVH